MIPPTGDIQEKKEQPLRNTANKKTKAEKVSLTCNVSGGKTNQKTKTKTKQNMKLLHLHFLFAQSTRLDRFTPAKQRCVAARQSLVSFFQCLTAIHSMVVHVCGTYSKVGCDAHRAFF